MLPAPITATFIGVRVPLLMLRDQAHPTRSGFISLRFETAAGQEGFEELDAANLMARVLCPVVRALIADRPWRRSTTSESPSSTATPYLLGRRLSSHIADPP